MLEKGKINAGEFHILVIVYTIGSSILVSPSLLASIAEQDAWIASILAIIISLSFIFVYNHLASLYPEMTFIEYNEKILGKWVGKITSLQYIYFFFYLSSELLREIGDFFTTQILVETPLQIVMIMFVVVSLLGVRLGLEVICRTAVIFFPWTIGLIFLLFLFLIPEIKIENIQPMLGEGLKPTLKGAYHILGLPYLELAIFLMIKPYITDKEKTKKAFYLGFITGGLILSSIAALSIFVLDPATTARQAYPSYILGKKISIGDFLERIEVIVAIIWFFTIYFKLTISFYGISLGLAQVLELKDYKILLFPLAFLIISFAIFTHPNIVHFRQFVLKAWTPYSLTVCLFLPLLLLVIGKIKKNKRPGHSDAHTRSQ
ncbi:endospore germination permease [Niallia oryzisoli]|uniref:Endospore germination permease n=1 Tax=Niallia oryzisoli TaxID=1737571 RepID=A0ABZ2CGS9_9BACI